MKDEEFMDRESGANRGMIVTSLLSQYIASACGFMTSVSKILTYFTALSCVKNTTALAYPCRWRERASVIDFPTGYSFWGMLMVIDLFAFLF